MTCRVPFEYLDEGSFRRAYQVVGLPLVAKFPYKDGPTTKLRTAIHHTKMEVQAVEQILQERKFKALRQYMPKIYFFNPKTGTVLMHKYKPLSETAKSERVCEKLGLLVAASGLTAAYGFDLSTYNVGTDEAGKLVIFDLGLFNDY